MGTAPAVVATGGLAPEEVSLHVQTADLMVQPYPDNQIQIVRPVEESGYLSAPWGIDDGSLLMASTGTLMERQRPYHLLVELARGKVNQVRCQEADWRTGGLSVGPHLHDRIQKASNAFGHAVVPLMQIALPHPSADTIR